MRVLRWLGRGLAGIALLLLLAAAAIWFISWREVSRGHIALGERLAAPSAAQMANAERFAHTLGCLGCHGAGLRGDTLFDERGVATLWAPNLTLVASHASDQQLAAAIRQGIGTDGRALWAMPSNMFAHLSDGEVASLIAVIRRQPRGGAATPPIRLGPIGRFGIAFGQLKSSIDLMEDYRVRAPYDLGPQFAAGRRLATISCTECHGPTLDGGDAVDGRVPPDLTVAGAYDPAQFRRLMRTGHGVTGRDLGVMAEVARGRFAYFNDGEVSQLYAYLHARAERMPQ